MGRERGGGEKTQLTCFGDLCRYRSRQGEGLNEEQIVVRLCVDILHISYDARSSTAGILNAEFTIITILNLDTFPDLPLCTSK